MFSIHKVKELLAEMKISAFDAKHKYNLNLSSYLIFGQF